MSSEDIFWSKVSHSRTPVSDEDEDELYEQSKASRKAKQTQKAFTYIDDGVEDPFDQLAKLERAKQRKEKAKGNKNLVGVPIKGEKFKPTVGKNSEKEERAQYERASARDRKLEKEAVKTLKFAVPFEEEKKKDKKVKKVEESAEKDLASINLSDVENAIKTAQNTYASSPSFQVKDVLGTLESRIKSKWEQTSQKEQPLQYLSTDVSKRLSQWINTFSQELLLETLSFIFDTIYSQQGTEKEPGKFVFLKVFLQVSARTKPAHYTTVLQKNLTHFATNSVSFSNLLWLLSQVDVTANPSIAGWYLSMLLCVYAAKFTKFQAASEGAVDALVKLYVPIVTKSSNLDVALGIDTIKALLILKKEDKNEKSATNQLFEQLKSKMSSSSLLVPLLELTKDEKIEEQAMDLLYSLFKNNPSAFKEWAKVFPKHIDESLKLFEALDNVDEMPKNLRNKFVETLGDVQQSLNKLTKDKKATQAAKRLQSYLEATPTFTAQSSTSWFGVFFTLFLFTALVIAVIFIAPEYCRTNITNPTCDTLFSLRENIRRILGSVIQVKK